MKKLPIGIQTFQDIRNEDYAYVDKTAIALKLIENGRYYFLSRPRRFGKSLFIDTLQDIFEGKKSLFKGLAIEDQWDWETSYPVIKISFGAGVHQGNDALDALDRTILSILKSHQKHLKIGCENTSDAKECFAELIEAAYEKYGKVVILVDEYDKPILDNITDKETARIMSDRLKNIYSVIKDSDRYIKFVFITGVSKFSKVNFFSGLNNLNDITLDSRYATVCGYTHHDLETTFKEHLEGVDIPLIKDWYYGYDYLGDKVYNPFDILLFIDKGAKHFENYWWSTGNPSFLLKLLEEKTCYIPEMENYVASTTTLDAFDIDHIDLIALLWQTGYLTIKEKHNTPFGSNYLLAVPNREIQTSLNVLFITYLTTQTSEILQVQQGLYHCLEKADLKGLEELLKRLFSSIPYHNFTNNNLQSYEGYYSNVMYAYLASLGFELIAEDIANPSCINLALKLEDKTYLFEIKVVKTPVGKALEKIKKREYVLKYQEGQAVYVVGIEFCKEQQNICLFEWEELEKQKVVVEPVDEKVLPSPIEEESCDACIESLGQYVKSRERGNLQKSKKFDQ